MKKILVALALIACTTLQAQIKLPPQVGDYMVLQQKTRANLWGWADAGKTVTVTTSWNQEKYTAKAGADGAWKVAVATPEGSFQEHTVSIACGKETVTLQHVLIGEVWLGSGQSNMEMPVKGFDNCPVEGSQQEIALAKRYKGRIRFAMLPKNEAYEPLAVSEGSWKESLPENVPDFGAAAWFFAKNLTEVLDVPVGVIDNAWGGSKIEGWLPREIVAGYPGFDPSPEACKKIFMAMSRPTIMYYGQWAPIRNYTFKGVLWYQGESNGNPDGVNYSDRMKTLIGLWREESGNPELPVYQVELAPFAQNDQLDGFEFPIVREQQHKAARETDNCWVVSTSDLVYPYEAFQVHPAQKRQVGERLSYLALHHTYGIQTLPGVAPTYAGMEVDGDKVIVNFAHVREAGGFNRLEGIEGFEVCGPDLVFHKAEVLPTNYYMPKIVVTSPEVKEPVAVRYCFRNWLPGNLGGANGLPVAPFRSDRILEGEVPVNPATLPDGDFEGVWKGSARNPELGTEPLTATLDIVHTADGWTCSVNGEKPQKVSVRGNKLNIPAFNLGGAALPVTMVIRPEGTVFLEVNGYSLMELKRQ